jgi:hypothetical protein
MAAYFHFLAIMLGIGTLISLPIAGVWAIAKVVLFLENRNER